MNLSTLKQFGLSKHGFLILKNTLSFTSVLHYAPRKNRTLYQVAFKRITLSFSYLSVLSASVVR